MTDFEDDPLEHSTPPDKPERFIANPFETADPFAEGPVRKPPERGSEYTMLLIGLAVLVVVALGIYLIKLPKAQPPGVDLGQAVFNAGGLRGHLDTRWQGNKAVYKLEFEPIDPTYAAGVAYAAANPPRPIQFNLRILDNSGFALCTKQVLLPFDPSTVPSELTDLPQGRGKKATEERAAAEQADLQARQSAETQREKSNDLLQAKLGNDGKIASLFTQGELPCTSDQYARFDYWDFSTNFPTVQEQHDLITHKAQHEAALERAASAAANHKAQKLTDSTFYVQGDVRVNSWDPASGMLGSGAGKSFYVAKASDRPVASGWASDGTLIHYKCDQHGICVLTQSGTGVVILGSLNQ
ncbi:MAG TPA: hypothetical protein VFU68_08735 [Terracidiphilus sp.]|nr:hypothetical protein [Terracidiphilus sp.]